MRLEDTEEYKLGRWGETKVCEFPKQRLASLGVFG